MTIKDTPIKKYFTSHYSAFSAKRQTNFVFIVFHELSQEKPEASGGCGGSELQAVTAPAGANVRLKNGGNKRHFFINF
ncbi:hypothetical protein M2416_004211 [Raoultella sp. BIGb0132]|jgi:hypothetical protein|nr:hypothetical protein [Raoultella terrigena]MCS4273712.1 hypothetical protein [Raoultella sp. BIGb0132]MCS4290713.1 hypothetical protein [Raoultella terrigena]